MTFLDYSLLGNSIEQYAISLAIFSGALLAIFITKKLVFARLKKLAEKTNSDFDDIIVRELEKNALPFLVVSALYLATNRISLDDTLQKVLHITIAFLLTVFAIRFVMSLISWGIERQWKRADASSSQRQTLKILQTVLQGVIWVIAGILLLDNFGIKISTLVAGLGIGGIAVALASQAVLGDFFAYFMVLTDRPFEIGDFICVDDFKGTVDHIGIKSTRIRSISGELLIFRNTDLTAARIRNYKKMEERRIAFRLGVSYETSLDLLKTLAPRIASIIKAIPQTRFDRAHFNSFGDYSLGYEVVYFVLSPDYNLYMDIQQEINFKIREEFDKLGVEFAFPTSTVYLARTQKKPNSHE